MKKQLIKIELPAEIWSQIASVCIYIADTAAFSEGMVYLTNYDISVLRKTYFQIKGEIR